MIYLTTGANGAGKTLLTLRDVRAKSVAENRPVYHNGRFEAVVPGELDSWQVIDAKDWQSCPDGSIIVIDECHNDFPVRTGKDTPDYIKMLAEHRRRGFDFYLISQHPLNIDAFVRRLIGSPGWHRHLKRASGAPLVSLLEWPSVNAQCERSGSGASGSMTMVRFPTEVYPWYRSTSLDTSKIKIPFQVKVLAALLLLVPVVGYFGWQSVHKIAAPKPGSEQNGSLPGNGNRPPVASVMTAAQYVESYQPRIAGLSFTAPRYDSVTQVTDAPYPVGCVSMGAKCTCYTVQGTKLPVDLSLCLQIVKDGYFKDWGGGREMTNERVATSRPVASASPPDMLPPGGAVAVP